MTYVRFQFRSTVFAENVRDQLARSDVGCIPPTGLGLVVDEISYPPAGPMPMSAAQGIVVADPGPVVVGAREAGDAGEAAEASGAESVAVLARTLHLPPYLDTGYEDVVVPVAGGAPVTLSKQRLLLTLPITLTVRALNDMIQGTGQPIVLTIDVQLSVDLIHRADADVLRVGYSGLGHHEGTDPNLEKLVATELGSGTIQPREVPFDYADAVFEALQKMGAGGDVPSVCWSGMTLSPDRNTVEFRLELNEDTSGTHRLDEWRRFYRRDIDSLRGDRDWAVGLSTEILIPTVEAGAKAEIENNDDFDLDGEPHAEWHPEWPGFRTTFSGEAIDACFCLFVQIDLNVDVRVDTQLSLAATGPSPTIQLDTFMHADPTSTAEQACCFITGGALWPIVGWFYVDRGQISWGKFLLGFFYWPLLGGFYAMAFFVGGKPQELEKNCTQDPGNEEHRICTVDAQLNEESDPCDPEASTISLDSLTGRSDAMVLSGAVQQRRLEAPRVGVTEATPFEWHGPRPTCEGTEGDWSAVSTFTVSQVGGEYPLEVCDVIAVGVLKVLYKPRIVSCTGCPTTVDVEVSTIPWTVGNPHPDWVLVLTNVGAVLVRIPVLPPLSDQQRAEWDAYIAKWRITHCLRPDGWWEEGELLPTAWSLGPPPRRGATRRVWRVRAGGLESGEQLVARGGEKGEDVLARGVAEKRKGVGFAFEYHGDQIWTERRMGGGRDKGKGERYGLAITQVLLEEVSVHELEEPAVGLLKLGSSLRPDVQVVLDDPELVMVLEVGCMPRLRPLVVSGSQRGPAIGAQRVVGRALERHGARDELEELRRTGVESARSLGLAPDARTVRGVARAAGRGRWVMDLGAAGWVEFDTRVGRATASYAMRPWSDGTVRIPEGYVRLEDGGSTVRVFAVRESLTL